MNPLDEIKRIIRELTELDEDSDEAVAIRNESDIYWNQLTEEQKAEARIYSAKLQQE